MRIRTKVRAGGVSTSPTVDDSNHNQTVVVRRGVHVSSAVRAGATYTNHNQTVVVRRGMAVRSTVRAGGPSTSPGGDFDRNHNQSLRVRTKVRAGGIGTTPTLDMPHNHNETLNRG